MVSYEYLAGIIDGEGCIALRGRPNGVNTSLVVDIVNTNKVLITTLQESFGGSIYLAKRAKANWKDSYHLCISGKAAIALLNKVRPFILAKKDQIDLALDFWQFHSNKLNRYNLVLTPTSFAPRQKSQRVKPDILAKEMEFRKRMSVLNRKGGF